MSNEITFAPAIIEVSGKTKTERQLSVMAVASNAAKLALANAKGKVGIAARNGIAGIGLANIAKAASNANYKPVAEYFAAQLGEPMVITNRASFEALPDSFEARIMKVRLSKSGGYTIDKKTGIQKPNATLSKLMELKSISVEMVAVVGELVANAKAEREATQATLTA